MVKGDEIMPRRSALSLEEQTSSLFQPDPLWSGEFFNAFINAFKRTAYLEPEKILMLAVLQDAITCLRKYRTSGSRGNKRLFDEANDWIQSDDRDWPFSFNNVCEAVSLNPGYLRRGLIQMSDRQTGSGLRRKVIASVVTVGMKSGAGDRPSGSVSRLARDSNTVPCEAPKSGNPARLG
jgi:hypothetical protein